jgi:hypothetical protein
MRGVFFINNSYQQTEVSWLFHIIGAYIISLMLTLFYKNIKCLHALILITAPSSDIIII